MTRAQFSQEAIVDIIAFRLHDQEFCVETTTIREIRGWARSTPIPHSPPDVLGVMNLRGTVIPIVDLASKLGMAPTEGNERCAIVVAEVGKALIGLVVNRVSDILTIRQDIIQPVPNIATAFDTRYARGIVAQPEGMVCFLDLDGIFANDSLAEGDWNARAVEV